MNTKYKQLLAASVMVILCVVSPWQKLYSGTLYLTEPVNNDFIQIDLIGSFDWSDSSIIDFGVFDGQVSAIMSDGIWAIDLSNPSGPVSAGSYQLEMDISYASIGIGFTVDTVPMLDPELSNGTVLEIYDIRDPSAPTLSFFGSYEPPGYFGSLQYIGDGFGCGIGQACGENQHLGYFCKNHLYTLDLSDVSSISIMQHWPEEIFESCWPSPGCSCHDMMSVTTEYIYDLEFGTFDIYDKSKVLIGSCEINTAGRVKESGDKAYIYGGGSISLIDISDPASPQLGAMYQLPPLTQVEHYADGYVYLSGGQGDLQILNLDNPVMTGSYDTPGNTILGYHFSDDTVWIGDEAGLYIIHTTLAESCCGHYTSGLTGNADCDAGSKRNLADITRLIDHVYISKELLCCAKNGNTNGDVEAKINLADITSLIDHIYIGKEETAGCL